MKPTVPYDVVVPASKAVAFYGAKKRERKMLLDFFEQLGRHPFRESDWTLIDAAGRTNFRQVVGNFLITYWSDHALREVRVVKIERVE